MRNRIGGTVRQEEGMISGEGWIAPTITTYPKIDKRVSRVRVLIEQWVALRERCP